MNQGDRKLRGTEERSASKLSIPVGLSSQTLNLTATVLEDEFRIANHPLARRHAISTGSGIRQEG
jgi:hypothetical protein